MKILVKNSMTPWGWNQIILQRKTIKAVALTASKRDVDLHFNYFVYYDVGVETWEIAFQLMKNYESLLSHLRLHQ